MKFKFRLCHIQLILFIGQLYFMIFQSIQFFFFQRLNFVLSFLQLVIAIIKLLSQFTPSFPIDKTYNNNMNNINFVEPINAEANKTMFSLLKAHTKNVAAYTIKDSLHAKWTIKRWGSGFLDSFSERKKKANSGCEISFYLKSCVTDQ